MPFINLRKKIRFFSFDFRQNFDVRTFPRWLSIRGTQFFWEISKKSKIFTLVLLNRFLDGFSKFGFFICEICILIRDFWVIFENYSMRMLSIRGNDFIACWAYAEPISSHAEHTSNKFPRMLSIFTWTIHAQHTRNEFYRTLSIRGRISSHAEHTGNWFHRMLSMRGNV